MRIKTELGEVYVEDGIMYTVFTEELIELEPLKRHHAATQVAFKSMYPLPSIVQLSGNARQPEKGVREFTADPKNNEGLLCSAVIVNSVFMKTLANLFFKFARPSVPTQLFTRMEDAQAWAKTFIKH